MKYHTHTLNDLIICVQDEWDKVKVEEIIKSGIEVNAKTEAGCTPLMFAVMPNDYEDYTGLKFILEMVEFLLTLGADKTIIDNNGFSAFDYVCQQNDVTWKGSFGGNPVDLWSTEDLEILEQIKEKLK